MNVATRRNAARKIIAAIEDLGVIEKILRYFVSVCAGEQLFALQRQDVLFQGEMI
tara:strand:- start:675 stop:839 length:165 start_codon:yes stop_codon:yes gene_type:complete